MCIRLCPFFARQWVSLTSTLKQGGISPDIATSPHGATSMQLLAQFLYEESLLLEVCWPSGGTVFMLVVLSFGCACAKPWRHLRKAYALCVARCEHSAADFLPPAHMASVDAQRCVHKNNNFHSFTLFSTVRCALFLVRCGSLSQFSLRSLQRKLLAL